MQEIQNNQWPGWETVRLIGRGSFGAVYEIQRDIFGDIEKAALKVISIPQNASDIDEMYGDGYDEESITSTFKSYLRSIVGEYSLMRKLNGCANVVNCDDVRYIQHDDGIGWNIYIKMELLTPLAKALPADIPEETVIQIARDICAALVLCKKHEIIHRDIKPQNIFVSSNGDYKLGDFGIAKTAEKTSGGTKIGTYKYMAPEVYNNQPYGSAADIYSLGLVLYWLLNERRMPFLPLPPAKLGAGMDETARIRRLSGEQFAEPKHGGKQLKAIVMKACAFNPEERYASASEMLSDLNRIGQNDAEVKAEPAPPQDFTTASDSCDSEEDRTVGMFGSAAPNVAATPDVRPDEDATVGLFFRHEREEAAEKERRRLEQEKRERFLWEQNEAKRRAAAQAEAARLAREQAKKDQQQRDKEKPKINKDKQVFLLILLSLLLLASSILILLALASKGDRSSQYNETVQQTESHNWLAASCTAPETCRICGEQRGVELGHDWLAASCTVPETCRICGEQRGAELGHSWPTGEKLSNCTVCNYPNGKIVNVDPSLLTSSWTDANIEFTLTNGKQVSCTVLVPDSPIEKCYSITLCLRIDELTAGNVHGEWGFYIRDLNGQWHLADTFILNGDYVEAYFDFEEPVSFDAWACPCHVLGDDWSFSFAVWLQDASVFEYGN